MGRLCDRITADDRWQVLEETAVHIVTSGGMAAMGYYRDAWKRQNVLSDDRKNPSTQADVEATVAILQNCHLSLSPIAGELLCGISYLGEESQYNELLRDRVSDEAMRRKHPPERFFASSENVLRVIFDGIDGTANFNRGLPIFCSAVAILVDDQVRVSAIYDPIHHTVYSAALRGPHDTPRADATASGWQVATGNRIDLIAAARAQRAATLKTEAVATHFTRTSPEILHAFLRPHEGQNTGTFEELVEACGGVYAVNSGLMAMTEVARGAFGAFVNVTTNPWDVAAGECLVSACGGTVSTCKGTPIRYDSPRKISVLAAKAHLYAEIRDLVKQAKTPEDT